MFKWGCATGLTRGRITVVSDPIFWVETTEVGDFAMRGDSGALIICSETNLVIGLMPWWTDLDTEIGSNLNIILIEQGRHTIS